MKALMRQVVGDEVSRNYSFGFELRKDREDYECMVYKYAA